MSTAVDIEDLSANNIGELLAIERENYSLPWTERMFMEEINRPLSYCLAAYEDGALAGYIIMAPYAEVWHLMNIAIGKQFQKKGYASRLIAAALDRTQGDDARGYTLEVRVSNTPAIKLYEKYGFVSKGVRTGYYLDDGEDALVMWKPPVGMDMDDFRWEEQ